MCGRVLAAWEGAREGARERAWEKAGEGRGVGGGARRGRQEGAPGGGANLFVISLIIVFGIAGLAICRTRARTRTQNAADAE